MFPRYVFICFLCFSIFMKLRLFTNLYAIHSFSYCLFMNWITLVPTPFVRKLSILYMLETDNSCFSWILLCLICFFVNYMKTWKWSRHCFCWAQLPRPYFQLSLWVCEHLSPLLSLYDCHLCCLDDDCCFFLNPQFYVVVWIFALP